MPFASGKIESTAEVLGILSAHYARLRKLLTLMENNQKFHSKN